MKVPQLFQYLDENKTKKRNIADDILLKRYKKQVVDSRKFPVFDDLKTKLTKSSKYQHVLSPNVEEAEYTRQSIDEFDKKFN